MTQRRYSSVLELEAADYFKLDISQVQMFNSPTSSRHRAAVKRQEPNKGTRKQISNHKGQLDRTMKPDHNTKAKQKEEGLRVRTNSSMNKAARSNHQGKNGGVPPLAEPNQRKVRLDRPTRSRSDVARGKKMEASSVLAISPFLADSSTASTNSLPSISSSPSVSPSLVCPHLSLDDILARHNGSKSPHTIGLCSKCRMDPPPNVHSPLSPAFKPSKKHQINLSSNNLNQKNEVKPAFSRGYSDQQVGARKNRRTINRAHEDSLDYYLEPGELRRLQMSPTVRNSVEFIRNTTTEAGRVLRIYKNSEPFENPLRICVSRGEFATLNNLLDYIGGRQLVPSGARYLFHLDGQLVYSVNELKHGSMYIVSGTRKFDHKANSILKEQHKREMESPQSQNRRGQPDATPSVKTLPKSRDEFDLQVAGKPAFERPKQNPPGEKKRDSTLNSRKRDNLEASKLRRGSDGAQKLATVRQKESKPNAPKQNQADNGGIKRQNSGLSLTEAKQRLADESTENLNSVSKSNENLAKKQGVEEKPVSLVRAKSELGSSPNKRRKNVTFVDTQWASNHDNIAQSEKDLSKAAQDDETARTEMKSGAEKVLDPNIKALNTSEIGIQVSDSIDGFLIDLPIAMPPRGDELKEKKNFLRKGQGIRNVKSRPPVISRTTKSQSSPAKKKQTINNSRRQVVTITERQLSLDEMDQLKDLDHGDHHSEAHKIQHVKITLDKAEDVVASDEEEQERDKPSDEDKNTVMVDDPRETINIGQVDNSQSDVGDSTAAERDETGWQYPGGRESSATPTERPISQSEANENVHARVTTPTPSLSTTGGDSISYDLATTGGSLGDQSDPQAKQIVPVCGKLCPGTDPPSSNFRLRWVNGFTINDQYPENSAMLAMLPTDIAGQDSDGLLSPAHSQKGNSNLFQFKPSERFHNWICYSRRHDELVYPAGVLVVLWSRKTSEQRYYPKHTSSVCCITLGAIDEDIAASGQLGGSPEKIKPAVHIWSLLSLDTLCIVDDEHFLDKRILSLKVRSSKSEGCELSASARDEKRLWVYVFYLNLSSNQAEDSDKAPKNSQTNAAASVVSVMKASKVLQAGQMPLYLVKVSNQRDQIPLAIDSPKQPLGDLLITFGRRHFQVWYADRKQRKLCILPMDKRGTDFVELVVKANCLARMSPVEFLVGDAAGGISLLLVNSIIKPSGKFKLSSKLTSEDKYSVETVPLYVVGQETSAPKRSESVTCLARVSGSIFVSGDSNCTVKFWHIDRKSKVDSNEPNLNRSCRLLNYICLPRDLGFICTIIMSKYNRQQSVVEFYVISTSNAILFGSVQLQTGSPDATSAANILANSSLSVLYEGHETFAINLVADCAPLKALKSAPGQQQSSSDYFTCSLDYKICKWSGKSLVWKSMLPSACASLAVHPVGFVLAVGSADGTVYILDKISGLLISYFPLTPVCINCLTYSRDGVLLAAGCANGSIFILPVYERGLKYKKVSIFQSPYPVVSLQFSTDNRYILTSVTNGSYQELILWDLPNFRYMRDHVKIVADRIKWFDAICSGSEDVRAIWENANLDKADYQIELTPTKTKMMRKRLLNVGDSSTLDSTGKVVNLSCHRLIRTKPDTSTDADRNMAIASDTRGCLRLFRYPCYDIDQGFYQFRLSLSPVNCCRFLSNVNTPTQQQAMFVSTSLDGSICLWSID